MTNFKDWNYEKMGFKSEDEMKESIQRVKDARDNPKNVLEERAANRARFDLASKDGCIDLKALEEGARLAELDRVVGSRLYSDKEEARIKADLEEVDKLLKKVTESIKIGNETKAKREFETQKAKADEELQKKIYSKHNVKTQKETEKAEAYKGLLKGLNLSE